GRGGGGDASHAEWEDPEVRPARACQGTARGEPEFYREGADHLTQAAGVVRGPVDEERFAALKEEIAAYVATDGEEWTRRIEAERAVPPELRAELRERGYLSLAGPTEYGGQGIPFSRYLELLELFSMSHASLRMIVHVANGVWRSVDQFATEEQRRDYVMPAV